MLDGGEFVHAKLLFADGDGQTAILVDFDPIGVLKHETDLRGVGLRLENELVSNLQAAAVEDEIDSRIELFVADHREGRDFVPVVSPGLVNVPGKLVQPAESLRFGLLVCARKSN